MMMHTVSMPLSHDLNVHKIYGSPGCRKIGLGKNREHLAGIGLSSCATRQDFWSFHLLESLSDSISPVPHRRNVFICQSFLCRGHEAPILKSTAMILTRAYNALRGNTLLFKLIPAVGILALATWGLRPLLRLCRVSLFQNGTDANSNKNDTLHLMVSYLQPLLLWGGAILLCRALDPIILPSNASQVVKQRLLNFARSLSTVLAFACCLSSLIQQAQKFLVETNDSIDARNVGFNFAGKAVYSAVWVAAVSLFMELLGFSTQKWLTAGGLGTVLLTLVGREILTNFLSSMMIHATRPFVLNEWIQTKIDGYEVSGTVEHVGWWSPTIIRGDDREAVHIPNHKFTVNIVRNLSQKAHWRIKTYLAISHLDVSKINSIVADMRKVLAKNPQVEQQRLHRRVFLDDIDPENQALRILVSCFVKTSRYEEYQCVKEALLLDLLRVIRHHGARLATPIRTVQRMRTDSEMDSVAFSDVAFTQASTNSRLMLIEPSYKINGDDKVKPSADSVPHSEEKDSQRRVGSASDSGPEKEKGSVTVLDSRNDKAKAGQVGTGDSVLPASEPQKGDAKADESLESNSEEKREESEGDLQRAQRDNGSDNAALSQVPEQSPTSNMGHGGEKREDKRDSTYVSTSLEENIVLGVALDGSKRMLPIEDDTDVSGVSPDSKDVGADQNEKQTDERVSSQRTKS